jgi:hypothetical protein
LSEATVRRRLKDKRVVVGQTEAWARDIKVESATGGGYGSLFAEGGGQSDDASTLWTQVGWMIMSVRVVVVVKCETFKPKGFAFFLSVFPHDGDNGDCP